MGCLWFIICRIFTTHDSTCPALAHFESIPLVSFRTLWEARTEEHWRNEKAFHDISHPFQVFGELIKARRTSTDADNMQRLEAWEAGTDNLGLLMAVALV
jgi:hypothetical protein